MAGEPDDGSSADAQFSEFFPVILFDGEKCKGDKRPPQGPDVAVCTFLGAGFRVGKVELFDNSPMGRDAYFVGFRVVALTEATNERKDILASAPFAEIFLPDADHVSAFRTTNAPVAHGFSE